MDAISVSISESDKQKFISSWQQYNNQRLIDGYNPVSGSRFFLFLLNYYLENEKKRGEVKEMDEDRIKEDKS